MLKFKAQTVSCQNHNEFSRGKLCGIRKIELRSIRLYKETYEQTGLSRRSAECRTLHAGERAKKKAESLQLCHFKCV
jgi:hypothetical protein